MELQVASDFWGCMWAVAESLAWPAFLACELVRLAAGSLGRALPRATDEWVVSTACIRGTATP